MRCDQVASGAASYYDKLSEMFMTLGTSCPRYAEYAALFGQSVDLQIALESFYATVVRFCSKAIAVMERSRKCFILGELRKWRMAYYEMRRQCLNSSRRLC